MKNILPLFLGAIVVLLLSLFGIKTLLFADEPSDVAAGIDPDVAASVTDTTTFVQSAPALDFDPTKTTYNNGLASFVYDATQLIWEEIPSDQDNGYPMSSFYLLDGGEALPRVDVFSAELTVPFADGQAEAEWEAFAKEMVMAYYTEEEHESVALTVGEPVVKYEDGITKAYLPFEAILEIAPEYSIAGSVRMLASGTKASITVAAHKPGETMDEVLYELVMSAEVNNDDF